jgi:hypothetical protein
MEDFMDHGYGTVRILYRPRDVQETDRQLFETETMRKIKYDPALSVGMELGEVGELFPGKDTSEEARAVGDIVTQLWSF